MTDYQTLYCKLFNGITDAAHDLDQLSNRLKFLQQLTEELFLRGDDEADNQDDSPAPPN
ncbi:MAG: hypothetical protein QM689_11220 [Oscillospiraceae bacterium]